MIKEEFGHGELAVIMSPSVIPESCRGLGDVLWVRP
jgi:hypothetical protein